MIKVSTGDGHYQASAGEDIIYIQSLEQSSNDLLKRS